MPTFCRHNRLLQNCTICAREQEIEPRPVSSSSAPRASQPPTGTSRPTRPRSGSARGRSRSPAGAELKVRRLARGIEDGYRSALVLGLKSSHEADRLAQELAFAAGRLAALAHDPPGLYAEVATSDADIEERTWLAFLIVYFGPLEGSDPFAAIRAARTSWASGHLPAFDAVETGPRCAHDPNGAARTFDAYRAWARRAGSQAAAFTGEPGWAPARRFARVYERLALPGFGRDARFDLLVTLGRMGVYELRADSLQLGGTNEVTLAAKRVLGIGDTLLLERRAAELAEACAVPLDALDLGLFNWGRGERATVGVGDAHPGPGALQAARSALGLESAT